MEKQTQTLMLTIGGIATVAFLAVPALWQNQRTQQSRLLVQNATLSDTLWGTNVGPTLPAAATQYASPSRSVQVPINPGTATPQVSTTAGVTWNTTTAYPYTPTITGDGFGNATATDGQDITITDTTQGWTTGGSNPAPAVGSWTDTQIAVSQWTGYDGAKPLAGGDALTITITNPQTGQTTQSHTRYPTSGAVPVLTLWAPYATLAAGSTVTLTGTLTIRGQPLTNEPVSLTTNAGTLTSGPVTTDASGEYSVSYAAPDTADASITLTAQSLGLTAHVHVAAEPLTVSLSQSAPATSDHMFFNGTSVTLTATSSLDVSQFGGDALQLYDETTGQWMGSPATSGTSVSATVSDTSASNTYIAYIGPAGQTSGSIAQSKTLAETWIDPANVAGYLSIQATSYPGGYPGTPKTTWTYTASNPDVWAMENVLLTAQVNPAVYVPSSATLAVFNQTTGQTLYAQTGAQMSGDAVATDTAQSGLTYTYAAHFTISGTTYTTNSDSQNADVIWLAPWTVNLASSYSSGLVTLTVSNPLGYGWESGTIDGLYTDYLYLLDESTGQLVSPQAVTGSSTSASWTLPSASYAGQSFVGYVESNATFSVGSYGSTANTPPLETNTVEDETPAVSDVSVDSSAWPPRVTLTGAGFGTMSPTTGNTNDLVIEDHTQNWVAGQTGDGVGTAITNWSDGRIVFTPTGNYGDPWYIAPGGSLTIRVTNPQTGQTTSYNTTYPANATMPAMQMNPMSATATNGTQTLSGQVTFNGSALANQQVQLSTSGGSLRAATVTTNSSGDWSVTYTAPSSPGYCELYAVENGEFAQEGVDVTAPISIASVSVVQSVQAPPQVTWNGNGFGTSAHYAQLMDNTRAWQGGTSLSGVLFTIGTWNNNQVTVTNMSGYGGGSGQYVFAPGDAVVANITNASGQSASYSFTWPAWNQTLVDYGAGTGTQSSFAGSYGTAGMGGNTASGGYYSGSDYWDAQQRAIDVGESVTTPLRVTVGGWASSGSGPKVFISTNGTSWTSVGYAPIAATGSNYTYSFGTQTFRYVEVVSGGTTSAIDDFAIAP